MKYLPSSRWLSPLVFNWMIQYAHALVAKPTVQQSHSPIFEMSVLDGILLSVRISSVQCQRGGSPEEGRIPLGLPKRPCIIGQVVSPEAYLKLRCYSPNEASPPHLPYYPSALGLLLVFFLQSLLTSVVSCLLVLRLSGRL